MRWFLAKHLYFQNIVSRFLFTVGFAYLIAFSMGYRNLPLHRLGRWLSAPKEYRSHEATPVGMLDWVLIETATGNTLDSGKKPVHLNEIGIEKSTDNEGNVFFEKRIRLTKEIYFALSEFPDKTEADKTGFAFTPRQGHAKFNWEWFDLTDKDHATKLLETGELAVKREQINTAWEITQTKFLSDVSLRLYAEDGVIPHAPRWRILIKNGSFINWPSLVGDKVLTNQSSQ